MCIRDRSNIQQNVLVEGAKHQKKLWCVCVCVCDLFYVNVDQKMWIRTDAVRNSIILLKLAMLYNTLQGME